MGEILGVGTTHWPGLNQPDEAAGVVEAMDQAIKRVDLEIMEASDFQEELDLRDKGVELEDLRKVLQERLNADEEESSTEPENPRKVLQERLDADEEEENSNE